MPQDPSAMVWIDLEMTGLNPEQDRIIEIATIITDGELNIVAEGPVIAIHQDKEILTQMDEWNTRTHNETGLVERVLASSVTESQAEDETLDFVQRFVPRNRSPLCGNSICQDRRFMFRHMKRLEQYLHYRNLDVSTIKELARRWAPRLHNGFSKRNSHKAVEDIRESIAELRYYREHFLSAEVPEFRD